MTGLEAKVCGIPVWTPNRVELLAAIDAQLGASPRHCGPVRLFTLNPELVMLALRDERYRQTLSRAEWNVVDGSGLALAIGWRARGALPDGASPRDVRHQGSDLVFDLASAAERVGRPLLLVGGQAGRLEKACARLRTLFPALAVEGFSPGFARELPFPDQAALEQRIASLRPAVVVVCLGAPKQEQWVEQSLDVLARADVRIATGFGGTVDFLSGEVPRAPRVFRRLGAEWVFRLVVEPWRWKRQLTTLPAFALRTLFSPGFVSAAPAAPRAQAIPAGEPSGSGQL